MFTKNFRLTRKMLPPSPPTLNGDSGTGSKIIGCKALSRASILGHRNLLSAISFTIMWGGHFEQQIKILTNDQQRTLKFGRWTKMPPPHSSESVFSFFFTFSFCFFDIQGSNYRLTNSHISLIMVRGSSKILSSAARLRSAVDDMSREKVRVVDF